MSTPWRRWFPRKLLQWQEPSEFRRIIRLHRERTRSRWNRLQWATLLFALFIGPYLGRWLQGAEPADLPLWAAVLVSAGGAWVMVYVLIPWLDRLPTTVMAWECYLSRAHGTAHPFWRYDQLESCRWVHCLAFSVLTLEMKTARGGRRVFIGVPAGELVARVDAVLRERGVVPQVDETPGLHHFAPASSE